MYHSVCIYMFVILRNARNMPVRIHLLILMPHTQSYNIMYQVRIHVHVLILALVVSSVKCVNLHSQTVFAMEYCMCIHP